MCTNKPKPTCTMARSAVQMPKSRRRYEEVGIRRRRIACQGPRPRVTVKQRRDAYAVTKLTAYATLRCGQYSAESTIAASETAARPACRRKRVMRVSVSPVAGAITERAQSLRRRCGGAPPQAPGKALVHEAHIEIVHGVVYLP